MPLSSRNAVFRSVLLVASLLAAVPRPRALAAQVRDTASAQDGVRGVVRDDRGVPIAGAAVTAEGARTTTAADGAFRLPRPAADVFELEVRRPGFQAVRLTVDVDAARRGLTVTLVPLERALDPVRVAERVESPTYLTEFNRRRLQGKGRYVTQADVERRRPLNAMDLFRTIPGLYVDTRGMNRGYISFRSCGAPLVWIDGNMLASGYFEPNMINPSDIAGIEVYNGISSVPPELMGPTSRGSCGVIAIWTKRIPRAASGGGGGAPGVSQDDVARISESFQVFDAEAVDEPAQLVAGRELRPDYPDSLLRSGIGGQVVVEFVVDTNGVPELGTVQLLATTHPALSQAVLAAVPGVRYQPARRGRHAVRQLVVLPVAFKAEKPAPGTPPGGGGPTRPR